ncbi:MAG: DMT family transporter [Actinomycetota bacterium]
MKERATGVRARATGFGLVALAAALWGTDALYRRGLALELPAATIVFVEHAILVVATLPLLRRARPALARFDRGDWVALLLIGAGASAAATILFTSAFVYGDPTTPLLLQKLQPLIAVVGARILLGERLLKRFSIYLVAAIAGAYLISFPEPSLPTVVELKPALLAASAAALWGLGTVLGRRLTPKIDPAPLTALRFAIGLPAAGVLLAITDGLGTLGAIETGDAPALLLVALIPGLIALLIYYRGLTTTPAAAATIAEMTFPVTAVLVNYLAFEVVLTGSQWIGLALLSASITVMGLLGRRDTRAIGIRLRPSEASA